MDAYIIKNVKCQEDIFAGLCRMTANMSSFFAWTEKRRKNHSKIMKIQTNFVYFFFSKGVL